MLIKHYAVIAIPVQTTYR